MKHLRYLLMAALVAMPLMACDEDDDPVVDVPIIGTVTGTVSAEGTGLSGVGVTLVGATSQSATTGSGGAYTFTNVEAGGYGVSIDASTHSDVSFSQTSRTTTISTAGETATVDFSGSYIRTATITGVISASGAPLGGVSVTVAGGPDNVTNGSVTNAGGEYFATGLRGGNYTVSFTAPAGVTFATTSAAVTVGTGEAKTAHFPGDAIQLASISGAVTVDNVGTAGIAVALSGAGTASTETGPGGAFSFTNLTPGAYTVTVTPPAGSTFGVVAKNVTVGEGEAGVVNFAGDGPPEPATISGAVTVDDAGRAGVAMALSGAATATTETGAGGAYSFTNLAAGAFTVTMTAPAGTTFGTVAKSITVAAGDDGVVNFAGAGPVDPATISIQSITTGAGVPVILTAVMGQIEVTLNIVRGDRDLDKVDVVFTNAGGTPIVAATQTFAPAPAADAEAAPGDEEIITLSIPTNQIRMGTSTYVPVIFNGKANISANLWEVGAEAPIPTNDVPVVMTNTDVLMSSDGALIPGVTSRLGATAPTDIPTVAPVAAWNTGGLQYDGPIYISFSTTVQTASWAALACGAGVGTAAGTAATGIVLKNTWACAAVEAVNQTPGIALPTAYTGVALGPDGTAVGLPAAWSSLGATFTLGSEARWFVLTPGPAGLTAPAVWDIDNVGPTITMAAGAAMGTWGVAFSALFDQPWINASYALAQDATWVDAGVGNDVATQAIHLWDPTPTASCTTGTAYVTGGDLAETIASDGTPDGYQICASGSDLLANAGTASGPSNFFGVDHVAPLSRFHGTTTATPLIAGTQPSVSPLANTTIFGIPAPPPAAYAGDVWGLEALDLRSGFNQNAVVGFPADQAITRQTGTVNAIGVLAAVGPAAMSMPLSDNYVRTAAEWAFHGLMAVPGYYSYTGIVTDRAGNATTPYVRNWLTDDAVAPTISFVTFAAALFYAPGTAADFVIFGADDLEVITASMTVDYPAVLTSGAVQYDFTVGTRWDGVYPATYSAAAFSTAITGVAVQVPSLIGRIDFTCTGAAAPYASCTTTHALPPTLTEFNAAGTDASRLPVSVTPISFEDAGGNLSAASAAVLFNPLQFSASTAAPWDFANVPDIDFWQIKPNGLTAFFAEHTASTSIEDPYFTSVMLVLDDTAGTGSLIICGTFGVQTLTDNGLNRFWTSGAPRPSATSQCGLAQIANPLATYRAVGVAGDAWLVSVGIL